MRPVRGALRPASSLLAQVKDGLGALAKPHKDLIEANVRGHFADSLEIDENLSPGRERENRWDYLLGHSRSGAVVGFEPHSATTGEVSVVARKRSMASDQLRPHLKLGVKVAEWFWVASGKVDFLPYDKALLRIQNAGVTFVGGTLKEKHLAGLAAPPPRKKKANR